MKIRPVTSLSVRTLLLIALLPAAASAHPLPPRQQPVAGGTHRPGGHHRTAGLALRRPRGISAGSVPTSGLRVSHNLSLKPGQYHLSGTGSGALVIRGRNIVVNCRGVEIDGPGEGTGLHIIDSTNVVVRGLAVRGYHWGVIVERSSGIILQSCTSSHNADAPAGTVIPEDGREPQDGHGGGFLWRDCQRGRMFSCAAQHEWDALDLVRCRSNTFRGNDFSYVNNWGVHLWDSSHNTVAYNRCVWCTTGEGRLYQALSGWQTYDSAAVLIEHDSNFNLIAHNDLRYGGDGLFVRANEGPQQPGAVVPPLHPSNHNVVDGNDCSFSPNNAIEADLCDDNSFIHNNCSHSNYGFWLGYSRRSLVERNVAVGCASSAIQIENGQDGRIVGNSLANREDSPDTPLIYLYQNQRDATPSGPYHIARNLFLGSSRPVNLSRTNITVHGNRSLGSVGAIVHGDIYSRVTQQPEVESKDAPIPVISALHPDPFPLPESAAARTPRGGPRIAAVGTLGLTMPSSTPREALLRVNGRSLTVAADVPIVEVDGVAALTQMEKPREVEVLIPDDFWGRPLAKTAAVRVFNGAGWSEARLLTTRWSSSAPLIRSVSPRQIEPGQAVTVTGDHLVRPGGQPRVLLDGSLMRIVRRSEHSLTFKAPTNLLTSRGYNLIVSARGESPPIPITVSAPQAWEPRIISSQITPTVIDSGAILQISAVIRNNAPFPLLPAAPPSGLMYRESDSFGSLHIPELSGRVYLRATSTRKGGSWPYMWGLREPLAPGEVGAIEGRIRLEQPGRTRFRLGLVDGHARFFVDDVGETEISISPAH